MNVTIHLSDEAKRVLSHYTKAPEWIMGAIARATDLQHEATVGHIQTARMNAPMEFPPRPPEEGVMRRITGRLKQGLWASKAVVQGSSVISSIGDNVKYAAVHEFGGTITRRVEPGSVRLRAKAGGELVRGSTGGAVFAKRSHKRVREVPYEGGKSYTITIPARAPIRRGIEDRIPDYERAISQAVVQAASEKD